MFRIKNIKKIIGCCQELIKDVEKAKRCIEEFVASFEERKNELRKLELKRLLDAGVLDAAKAKDQAQQHFMKLSAALVGDTAGKKTTIR